MAVCGQGKEPQIITEGNYKSWYGSAFDTTFVWHPERIYIVLPDMELEFLLPHEHDRSGVANLFFKDRKSGEIFLLDSVKTNPSYQSPIHMEKDIAHIREARHISRFKFGSYDAILLYNNGKYISYDNLPLIKGMKGVNVTIFGHHPVQEADNNSLGWLGFRKFTDIIGQRTLYKNYASTAPYKILGYVFNPGGDAGLHGGAPLRILDENDPSKWEGETVKMVAPSYDGYFEMDFDDKNIGSILEISYPGCVTRGVNLKSNAGVFIVLDDIPLTVEQTNMRTGPIVKMEVYERTFAPDATEIWHPEQFRIIWPEMTVDFKLPYEEDLSGVANLLFRERKSGKISLLDHFKENKDGGVSRYYTRFEHGIYDVILLYNSGKYIISENLTFADGVRITVDMTGLSVQSADLNSNKWLELRKFNDMIGVRTIRSWYETDNSRRKVPGYIFGLKDELALFNASVKNPTAEGKQTFSASDGYFEYEFPDSEIGSMLEIKGTGYEDLKIEIEPNIGYFIVMKPEQYEMPKMIGTH